MFGLHHCMWASMLEGGGAVVNYVRKVLKEKREDNCAFLCFFRHYINEGGRGGIYESNKFWKSCGCEDLKTDFCGIRTRNAGKFVGIWWKLNQFSFELKKLMKASETNGKWNNENETLVIFEFEDSNFSNFLNWKFKIFQTILKLVKQMENETLQTTQTSQFSIFELKNLQNAINLKAFSQISNFNLKLSRSLSPHHRKS